MPRRFSRARREPAPRSIHLRLARLTDVPEVTAFCEHHHRIRERDVGTSTALSMLVHHNVRNVIVARRGRTLLGVALCGVTHGRAHLLELVVLPGRRQATIERRLLRRSIGNLRARGVHTLEFGSALARAATS